jgi:phage gpG-like protein
MLLEFSIEGEKELSRKLEGVSEKMRNWREEFVNTGGYLCKTFRDNFDTEGAMLGKKWAPLKASTLMYKMKHGYPSDILVRTGLMRSSFDYQADDLQVTVFNPVGYFKFHQSKAPRKNLPRRVMMVLDEKRKESIIKIFQMAVEKELQKR